MFDINDLDSTNNVDITKGHVISEQSTVAELCRWATKEKYERLLAAGGIADFDDAQNARLLAAYRAAI